MPDKVSFRKEMLRKRDCIPSDLKSAKDRAITERLVMLPEYIKAETVFLFASFRSEVDTFGLTQRAFDEGKRVVLPRVEGHNLGLYEIRNLGELVPGYMKIPEPSVLTDDRKCSINDIDAIIIPGAAFDASGNRIGYGGGFYDRLLGGLQKPIPVIAPAYEDQVVESVPSEPHDRKVNIIVTESRIIRRI